MNDCGKGVVVWSSEGVFDRNIKVEPPSHPVLLRPGRVVEDHDSSIDRYVSHMSSPNHLLYIHDHVETFLFTVFGG